MDFDKIVFEKCCGVDITKGKINPKKIIVNKEKSEEILNEVIENSSIDPLKVLFIVSKHGPCCDANQKEPVKLEEGYLNTDKIEVFIDDDEVGFYIPDKYSTDIDDIKMKMKSFELEQGWGNMELKSEEGRKLVYNIKGSEIDYIYYISFVTEDGEQVEYEKNQIEV